MNYRLTKHSDRLNFSLQLEASKSESNRALMLNALTGNQCQLSGLSNARDTQTMIRLLDSTDKTWDVKDAGTTMRFCTALLAITGEHHIITGTDRMKDRPIGPLVNSLRQLGASIEYLEKDGYPPLKISQITSQLSDTIKIPGNISSQYISALLMIAPMLEKGLEVELTTEIFSRPYIEMTLSLMENFGVFAEWTDRTITILPQTYQPKAYHIEGDWSGASYWYSMVALAEEGSSITLSYLKEDSYQGDQAIADIMEAFGVDSHYDNGGVTLTNNGQCDSILTLDFKDCPDLAQTVLACAAVKGIRLKMTGLESLRIKETDRIAAMQNELSKLGAELKELDAHHWEMYPTPNLPESISIKTYDDHRMAMAFAPLCQKLELVIEDIGVVDKSYPSFWKHIELSGAQLTSE